jgi:hypothetical protein
VHICWRQGCNGIRNQFSSLQELHCPASFCDTFYTCTLCWMLLNICFWWKNKELSQVLVSVNSGSNSSSFW